MNEQIAQILRHETLTNKKLRSKKFVKAAKKEILFKRTSFFIAIVIAISALFIPFISCEELGDTYDINYFWYYVFSDFGINTLIGLFLVFFGGIKGLYDTKNLSYINEDKYLKYIKKKNTFFIVVGIIEFLFGTLYEIGYFEGLIEGVVCKLNSYFYLFLILICACLIFCICAYGTKKKIKKKILPKSYYEEPKRKNKKKILRIIVRIIVLIILLIIAILKILA